MIYSIGDDSPALEWIIDTDLSPATVIATYTRSDNSSTPVVCTKIIEQGTRFGKPIVQTRIIAEWAIDDLSVLGVGFVTLRWATSNDTGILGSGWRIVVIQLY